MSHCTTFPLSYTDEATIVAAFRQLGLQPTTNAVAEYGSNLSKALLGRLGYAGNGQLRAIVARAGDYQMFVVREGEAYRLLIERHGMNEGHAGEVAQLEARFRTAYVRASLQSILDGLDDAAVHYELQQDTNGFDLRFGPELARRLRITFADGGHIREDVSGVVGDACQLLTAELEELLAGESAVLDTVWKPEQSLVLDDEVVQVLRLR